MSSDSGGGLDGQNHFTVIGVATLAILTLFYVVIPVLPVLLVGGLLGIVWSSSFGFRGSNRFAGAFIFISTLIYLYLIGIPTHSSILNGVLFSDSSALTRFVTLKALTAFNHVLPNKFKILSISVTRVQLYLWISYFVAALSCFLILRFSERNAPIFKGLRASFETLPKSPERIIKLLYLAFACFILSSLVFKVPHFVSLFNYVVLLPLALILSLLKFDRLSKIISQLNFKRPIKHDRVLIGIEKSMSRSEVNLTSSMINHHVQIVGASGFGKSVLLSHIIRSRIESGSGMLFIDLKADFETIRQVVSIAKNCNRLDDLQIFSCGNPEFSNSYNVLASGSANQLKDRIMGAFVWSEEFYKNEAESFLLRVLRVLTHFRDQFHDPFDLKSILNLIQDVELIKTLLSKISVDERELIIETTQLTEYLSSPENRKSLKGLKSQIESLIFSDFGELLRASGKGIDLFDAVQSRKIVFILLDSRTYGHSAASLGKLIIQDLKAVSARIDNEVSRNLRVPFSVVIDEFADLATEDFVGFLDRARSSKMGVVVSHQEVADLDKVSPEFTRRLMNSTSTIFSFLQKLPDSSELIAGVSGTRKVEEVTEQAERTVIGNQRTGMRSIKVVDEFIIHPNVLRSLKVGECVLIGKYPEAYSKIVQVRREVTSDYMDDISVRQLLSRTSKVRVDNQPVPTTEVRSGERTKF